MLDTVAPVPARQSRRGEGPPVAGRLLLRCGRSRPQIRRRPVVLVELGLVEQRYQAVLEVLNDGATVTDVARRFGVARQTVHDWLRRYADQVLGGLVDRSSKPLSCPHQMAPVV